eukprot:9202048-Alexandrium_andersonii.AAC.1
MSKAILHLRLVQELRRARLPRCRRGRALVEKARASFQLRTVQLGHELQVCPRCVHAPGDLLLIHPRM